VAARLLGLRFRIPPRILCLSLESVVCCQVEVSASGCSLVQRSPTKCGVSECDREAPKTEKIPYSGLDRPLGFQETETPRLSRRSAHEGSKVVSPTHRPPLPLKRCP
jgi:hypothetical protein